MPSFYIYPKIKMLSPNLSPSINKFDYELIYSGLSAE